MSASGNTSGAQPDAPLRGREVSCRLIASFLDAVAGKDLPLRDFVRDLPYSLEHLRDRHERIDWVHYVTLLRRLDAEFEADELDRLASDFTNQSWTRPFTTVARLLYSPADFYRWAAGPGRSLIRRLYTCVEPTLHQVSPRHLVLELRAPREPPPPELFFRGAQIALAAVPTVSGLGPADVHREPIEGGARFDILLPREAGFAAAFRRWVAFPFTAREAARELREAHELLEDRYRRLHQEMKERQHAEKLLHHNRERYRLLAENAQDIIQELDRSGRFRYVSANVQPQLGYTVDELLALEPAALIELIHPEEQRLFFQVWEELERSDEGTRIKYRVRHARGGWRWFESTARGFRSGTGETRAVIVARDVTDQETARAALQESEEKFRELADHMSEAFWLTDLSATKFLYVSPGFERMMPIEQVSSPIDLLRVVHPADRTAVVETFGKRAADQAVVCEFRVLVRDAERWVRIRRFPVRDTAGRVYRLGGIAEDVTDRRHAADMLQAKVDELARADHAKNDFLGVLAHELRNPLAAVSNAVRLLREGSGEKRSTHQQVGVLDRQSRRLARLVDDLLDVARITSGRIDLRPAKVDFAEIVRNAIEAHAAEIEQSGHELRADLPADPIELIGDGFRLEQVVSNLLSNAVRYTPPGGHIQVEVAETNGEIEIHVRDDGIGIRPELQAGLLEARGWQPSGSSAGLGLGLRVVRQLVELHGGRIDVHSKGLGLGSEFVVSLPRSSERWVRSERARSAKRSEGTDVPRRVLLIDDDADVAETLGEILRTWGHDVKLSADGPSGVEAAKTFAPDIVLVDIGLPGMNGYEVARVLRLDPALCSAVLVAVTGFGRDADRAQATDAGFDHHLLKPDVLAPLREILRAKGR